MRSQILGNVNDAMCEGFYYLPVIAICENSNAVAQFRKTHPEKDEDPVSAKAKQEPFVTDYDMHLEDRAEDIARTYHTFPTLTIRRHSPH
jgi:hypothetical protein